MPSSNCTVLCTLYSAHGHSTPCLLWGCAVDSGGASCVGVLCAVDSGGASCVGVLCAVDSGGASCVGVLCAASPKHSV